MANPTKQKKKVRKNIQTGVAHISATFTNTIVSITDVSGNVVAWSSARTCGIAERQCRGYYHKALMMTGVTGHTLIQLLERRLDNVVYRMGFASDHAEARQRVRHGHFTINGKKVNIPSYLVRPRDVVQVREGSQKIARINEALAAVDRRGVPQWIQLDKDNFRGAIVQLPSREDVTLPIREQLI